jgi:low temperature requirement protein LtrA
LGLLFLLIGGILSAFDVPKASDRRFVTPLIIYVACVLMTAGLVDYAALQLINSHSSRAMITAVVFAYTALSLSGFVAGRHSTFERTALVNSGVHLTTHKYTATNANGL